LLFSLPAHRDHESDKERNLYAKFFAGYWFNELVDGLGERIQVFCDIVSTGCGERIRPVLTTAARVTLDFHSHGVDGGECADILVTDFSTGHLVAIEAKLGTNVSYEKDVAANATRIADLASRHFTGISTATQCLLITEAKKARMLNLAHLEQSTWHKLELYRRSGPKIPLSVMTWEEFAARSRADVASFVRQHVPNVATRKERRRAREA
jgi:hypothetical protein